MTGQLFYHDVSIVVHKNSLIAKARRRAERFFYRRKLIKEANGYEKMANELTDSRPIRAINLYLKCGRMLKVASLLADDTKTSKKAVNLFHESAILCFNHVAMTTTPQELIVPLLESIVQLHLCGSCNNLNADADFSDFLGVFHKLDSSEVLVREGELSKLLWRATMHSCSKGNFTSAAKFCYLMGDLLTEPSLKAHAKSTAASLFSVCSSDEESFFVPHAFDAATAYEGAAEYSPKNSDKLMFLSKAFNLPFEDNLKSESLRKRLFDKQYAILTETETSTDALRWLTLCVDGIPTHLRALRSLFASEKEENLILRIGYLHTANTLFYMADDTPRYAATSEQLGDLLEDPHTKRTYFGLALDAFKSIDSPQLENQANRIAEKIAALGDS